MRMDLDMKMDMDINEDEYGYKGTMKDKNNACYSEPVFASQHNC